MFHCTGKHIEKWFTVPIMAKESHENFSSFDLAFGLERSEGENQKKPKSEPMNENNSAEEDGSIKKRGFVVVESKDRSLTALRECRTPATKSGFCWLSCQ